MVYLYMIMCCPNQNDSHSKYCTFTEPSTDDCQQGLKAGHGLTCACLHMHASSLTQLTKGTAGTVHHPWRCQTPVSGDQLPPGLLHTASWPGAGRVGGRGKRPGAVGAGRGTCAAPPALLASSADCCGVTEAATHTHTHTYTQSGMLALPA